ncbi:unnamed protein product, partial [Amoebophrya sp. A25]|eukprot:GSA25T00024771001.1
MTKMMRTRCKTSILWYLVCLLSRSSVEKSSSVFGKRGDRKSQALAVTGGDHDLVEWPPASPDPFDEEFLAVDEENYGVDQLLYG